MISSAVMARGRVCLGLVLALGAALSPAAFGAPSKHRKPPKGRRAPPAAAAPRGDAEARAPGEEASGAAGASLRAAEPEVTAADTADTADTAARSEPPGRARASTSSDDRSFEPAEERPPATRTARRPTPSVDPRAERADVVGQARATAVVADEVERAAPNDEDARALGRREAARVAAGRIEVAVSASIDAGRRVFTYSDPVGAPPQPYRLPVAPLATFGLEVYPLASTDIPVVRDLGLRGRVSRGFAMESSTGDGVPLQDSWTRFGGDLRQRLLWPARGLELGVTVGVDASYFDLRTDADVGSLVPAARMLSLRLGLDGRIALTRRLAVLAGGGYLATLTRGQIYERFRRPHVAGLDGQLAAAFALVSGVEARLEGRYTRYYASFAPEVGDLAVAGGALDEQMQLGLGLRFAH